MLKTQVLAFPSVKPTILWNEKLLPDIKESIPRNISRWQDSTIITQLPIIYIIIQSWQKIFKKWNYNWKNKKSLYTTSGALARSLTCMYLYNPIILNGYIYSPGKKIEKIEKIEKNWKNWKKSQVQLISRQSILKQGFQKNHFPMVL